MFLPLGEDLAIPLCTYASAESGFISITLSKSFMPSLRYPDLYLQIPLLKSATSDLDLILLLYQNL